MVGFGAILRRGVAAGAAAGLAAALVIWLVVEPVIRKALAIEDARETNHLGGGRSAPLALPVHTGGEPLVSRSAQVVGGALTSVIVGIAFGVIFAIVFVKVRERLGGTTDFAKSVVLAGVGFGAVSLLPALKMPANPPAVGDPATVGRRTMLYAVVLLLGVAAVLLVAALDRWLAAHEVAPSLRWAADIAAGVVAVALVFALVPGSPDAIPSDVPAALIWEFRLASLAQLAVMWLVLGVSFGLLMERAAVTRSAVAPAPA
ncbi:CbtA family protein [Monashia sp. NPDC004114]